MRIGELAERCGLPARTIRYYERRGLMAEPDRTPSGYRQYDATAVQRLELIRAGQRAGMTLREIREITEICDAGAVPCARVRDLLDAKLVEVRERRAELDALESELVGLIERAAEADPSARPARTLCQILQPTFDE